MAGPLVLTEILSSQHELHAIIMEVVWIIIPGNKSLIQCVTKNHSISKAVF